MKKIAKDYIEKKAFWNTLVKSIDWLETNPS